MPAGTLTTKGEFNSQESRTEWGYLENGKWVYDKSNVLYVPFDTFSDMIFSILALFSAYHKFVQSTNLSVKY